MTSHNELHGDENDNDELPHRPSPMGAWLMYSAMPAKVKAGIDYKEEGANCNPFKFGTQDYTDYSKEYDRLRDADLLAEHQGQP
jgi:hypothetical protein